jgi:hypothetical protein
MPTLRAYGGSRVSDKQNTLVRSAATLRLTCEVVDGELVTNLGFIGMFPIISKPGEGIIIRAEGMEVIVERHLEEAE